MNPSPTIIIIKELDRATNKADKEEPTWYVKSKLLPPKRFSAHPAGIAPKPNMKALTVTTNPRISKPTLNSFLIIGIKLGKANIKAWTERWLPPVMLNIIFSKRVINKSPHYQR